MIGTARARLADMHARTKALLGCGIGGGILFLVANAVQAIARQGFDIRRHPLSLLELGDGGWIQRANFVVSGLLVIAGAFGMRRALAHARAGTLGPWLVGIFGIGMIVAGLFVADPGLGFPPGAPEGQPQMSWHGTLHGVGFGLCALSLIGACVVFARRSARRGQRGWEAYNIATAIAVPVLIGVGSASPHAVGLPFAVLGLVMSAWIALVFAKLATEVSVLTGAQVLDHAPAT